MGHDHDHDHGGAHDDGPPPTLGRRQLLARGAYVAAGAAVGAALSACGSSNGSDASAQTSTSGAGQTSTSLPGTTAVPAPTTPRPSDPAQAFEALQAGNERYATGAPLHPNQGVELRKSFADSQDPFIAVLACADSRVIPEIIFDQGISDIFDVRVAGNIADPASVASLVYAVEVLGVDLITVMGHSNCGAVKAAIDVQSGKMPAGEFAPLTDAIEPAVAVAQPTSNKGDQLQKTIDANAKVQVDALVAASPALTAAVKEGRLLVVPSVYDLETGRVRVLT